MVCLPLAALLHLNYYGEAVELAGIRSIRSTLKRYSDLSPRTSNSTSRCKRPRGTTVIKRGDTNAALLQGHSRTNLVAVFIIINSSAACTVLISATPMLQARAHLRDVFKMDVASIDLHAGNARDL